MINVRASIRLSYGFLADSYTAFAIEDTIRQALLVSVTFQNAVAFSSSRERETAGIRYADDITHLNYRNLYTIRNNANNRRIDQLTLTEILSSTHESVPLIPLEMVTFEDTRDHDPFISISIAPNYDSEHYALWQATLIHEIIHVITDASDPLPYEQRHRSGPTEILTNNIADEMCWLIPVFEGYSSDERTNRLSILAFECLRQSIFRHHERAYQLLERLYDISAFMASPNFRGINTLSSDNVYHTSDEDTPERWRTHVLTDDPPPRSPDEDRSGSYLPFFSGASASDSGKDKDIFAQGNQNIIFGKDLPLTTWHLEKYNLVISAMAVNRVEEGGGFYEGKYDSWKEWYKDKRWRKVLGKGIIDHGFYQANGTFLYNPYGFRFYDGSFAVGVTGNDVEDVVNVYGCKDIVKRLNFDYI